MVRIVRWLALLLLPAALHARAAEPQPRLLAAVAQGMVNVEIDLQFDKGEPPAGVLDVDPGSRNHGTHSLAEVVAEERPLETTGFLIAPDRVVAMDWTVHPRFIKGIRVRSSAGQANAKVEGYGVDHWAVFLRLDAPLAGASPFKFGSGKPAAVGTLYRLEAQMVRELLPFPSRLQQAPDGATWRVVENQGVVVARDGTPLGVLFNRRLPTDDSWQGSPARWPWLAKAEYDARLDRLGKAAGQTLVRARLSFRSPKATPGQARFRFPNAMQDTDEEDSTERDVVGVVLAPQRVALLAALKPATTARLQKITLHPATGPAIAASFVASLKDHGILVAEPEAPLPAVLAASPLPMSRHMERLTYRVDLELHGEHRVQHLHHARINAVHVGRRLEGFPELPDASDTDHAFLFAEDSALIALPVPERSKSQEGPRRRYGLLPDSQLTPARLVADALRALPASADPANIPVSEADESRLAWLGVELQPMTRELARASQVSEHTKDGDSGAVVTFVHPGSPAAEAGLVPGAVLLRLRVPGEPVPVEVELEEDLMRSQPFPWERLDDIREQVFDRLPTPWAPAQNAFTRSLTDIGIGRACTLEYVADGKLASHDFTVTAGPAHYESAARHKSEALGLTVRNLTYEVRRYTQRPEPEPGVVVSRLEPGGKASVAGIKPYEIITHINDQPVADVAAFQRLAAQQGELRLSIKRMAKGRIVTLKAP